MPLLTGNSWKGFLAGEELGRNQSLLSHWAFEVSF